MIHSAQASSVSDRYTAGSGRGEQMPNSADHRFARNGAGHRFDGHNAVAVVHRVAGRDVVLRRVATRRRLARIDPEAIERRAWRLIGGGVSSPTHP